MTNIYSLLTDGISSDLFNLFSVNSSNYDAYFSTNSISIPDNKENIYINNCFNLFKIYKFSLDQSMTLKDFNDLIFNKWKPKKLIINETFISNKINSSLILKIKENSNQNPNSNSNLFENNFDNYNAIFINWINNFFNLDENKSKTIFKNDTHLEFISKKEIDMKSKPNENEFISLKILNNTTIKNFEEDFDNDLNNYNFNKISKNTNENIELDKLKFENCFIIDKNDLLKENYISSYNSEIDKKFVIEKENEKIYLQAIESISKNQRNENSNKIKKNENTNIDIFDDKDFEEKFNEILSINNMIIDKISIKKNLIELIIKKEKPSLNLIIEITNLTDKNKEENYKFSELKINRNDDKKIDIDIICEDISDCYFLNYVFQSIE
jgi:hypothetical protein